MNNRINVTLSTCTRVELDKQAKDNDRSLSEQVRQLINDEKKRRRRRNER